MSLLMQKLFGQLYGPAGEDGSGGGGPVDRGDDFESTDPDDDDVAVADDEKKPEAEKKGLAKAENGEEDDTADDEEVKPKREPKIPLSRHKEMLEKARSERENLERKLAQYEQGTKIAATNEQIDKMEKDVETLDAEYAQALTEGEHAKAAEIMKKLRKAEREMAELRTNVQVQAAESRAIEKVRFDVAVERLEEAYPQLNPADEDNYDEALVAEVLELQRGYVLQNYTPTKALQKAVKYVLGTETSKQKDATSVQPRVDKDEVETHRRESATRKAAQAAGKTPSAMKAGMDTDRSGRGSPDVTRMTQAQFAKLSEDELSKLRGDTV